MKEKYIQLIDKQIEKLSKEDFNLDAWKSSTIYLLTRIFGEKDPKIKEIDSMKIDYSSWSLRDSDSKYKPIDTCKSKGKEILEIARDEVELFGVTDQHEKKADEKNSQVQYWVFGKSGLPSTTIDQICVLDHSGDATLAIISPETYTGDTRAYYEWNASSQDVG